MGFVFSKMNTSTEFDYVFCGAGLAGLMLAYKMKSDVFFENASLLIIDPEEKKTNDRTWCFWDDKPSIWQDIVAKKWSFAAFNDADETLNINLKPLDYRMIEGLDFYQKILSFLTAQKNVHFLKDTVLSLEEKNDKVFVQTALTGIIQAEKVFDSRFDASIIESQANYPYLKQHFKGWFIETENAVFDTEKITFMDFSVAQNGHTRFMYVLPFTEKKALVEYTLFSEKLLPENEYDEAIKFYIKKYKTGSYTIERTEKGNIPMTCFLFDRRNSKNVIRIGSAGGWTKASTGFTFKNTDRISTRLVNFLKETNDFRKFKIRNRFWFYDLILLDVLSADNQLGASIFSAVFSKNKPKSVFRFLDEQSSVYEDLKIILSCPKKPFIKAFFRRIRNGF